MAKLIPIIKKYGTARKEGWEDSIDFTEGGKKRGIFAGFFLKKMQKFEDEIVKAAAEKEQIGPFKSAKEAISALHKHVK